MWKKILVIFLLVVMVLSFITCGEAGSPSAQEIVDGVTESFGNIRTYQFDMVMTQDQVGEIEDEAIERTVTINISGVLDFENVQMRMESTMNVVAPEEGEEEIGVEMYIVDDMMYVKPDATGEEPMWMKSEVPAEAWEIQKGMSGLENHKELLETAQVEVIGSEKVKGVDCYVLQLTPEMTQLWQSTMGPTGVAELGMPTVPEEILEEVFSDFTVKQWIAKDTYFLMKAEIDMDVESTAKLMDYLGEEVEMAIDFTLSFLAYNYNQPVTIVVPQEALEAEEMIGPTEPPPEPHYLWAFDMDELQHIVISLLHDDKSEGFVQHEDRYFYFDYPNGPKVDMSRWGGAIPLLLSGPTAESLIAKDATGEVLAEFGFTKPLMEIVLTIEREDMIIIDIGVSTPDGSAYYIKLADSNDVYIVDYTWYEVLERLVLNPPYPTNVED